MSYFIAGLIAEVKDIHHRNELRMTVLPQQIIATACRVALYFLEKEYHEATRKRAQLDIGIEQAKQGLRFAAEPPSVKAMPVHEWPKGFDIYVDDGIPPDHVYVMDSNGQRKAYRLRLVDEPAKEGEEAVSVLPDGPRREDDGSKQS